MFTIEKDLSGIFWHIYNNARTRVNVSDFDVVIDSVSQTFIVQCKNGSNIPSQAISISLIQVIDLSVGTSPIAFSGADGLIQLLMAKNYTPYLQDAPSQSVVVYRVGQVGVFTMTNQQFIDNFDSSGLGRNTMLGWALRNQSNGTKNQQGKFSLNKGASPYDVIGAIGGSANAVLIGHDHDSSVTSDNKKGVSDIGTGSNFNGHNEFTGLANTKILKTSIKGKSNTGADAPSEDGLGKNMPPYLIDVWVERVTELVINAGGSGSGGGVQTVTGVNVTGTSTDRVIGVPTLQQVTDDGNNETTNDLIVKDSESKILLRPRSINFNDIDDGGSTFLSFEQTSVADQEVFIRGLGGTMALTSDIQTLSEGQNINIVSDEIEVAIPPIVNTTSVFATTASQPGAITTDSLNNVYVVTIFTDNVTKITTSGSVSILGTIPGASGAFSIATDSLGNVYTANSLLDNVTKIDTLGVSTILGTTGNNPSGIVVDSLGNVYTCNQDSDNVTKIDSSGSSSTLGTTSSSPLSIAIDSLGNIYTANLVSDNVTKITPDGSSITLGTTGNEPFAIVVDSLGNVYTANYSSNNVTKITPDGSSSNFAVGTNPIAITIDSLDNVYVGTSVNIVKITPSGVLSILEEVTGTIPFNGLTVDSLGNVYTSNGLSNNVLKITIDTKRILAVDDNLNIIRVDSSGGDGSQTLGQTLLIGQRTDGSDIIIDYGDAIVLNNTSSLREGSYNFGGNGGISRICSNNYEDMWQNGFRHVFDQSGFIRHSTNCFNIVPDETFDVTLRFSVDSLWTLDNGTTYKCTDATEGAAVWELYDVGGIPTLQEVTDGVGNNVTPSEIFLYNWISSNDEQVVGSFVDLNTNKNLVFQTAPLTDDHFQVYQDASGTVALTSDIPTTTSQLTNDGADGVNPFITALDIPTTGQASTLVREVKNMTGATLTKGTVVYISGANGNKALVSKAIATTDPLSARTFGLLQSNILNNGLGNCVVIGDLSGIDTSSFAEGAQLYLSGVTAGTFTDTRVLAPTHLVYVGKVTRSHPTQGQIEVQIQNGYELAEIHDVSITSVTNNQLLAYTSATDLWQNKNLIDILKTFNRTQGIYFFEEFMGNQGGGITTNFTGLITTATFTGASCITSSTITNRTNQQGVIRTQTGTTATGQAGFLYGGANLFRGTGTISIETYVTVETLSTSTERFHTIFGHIGVANYTNPANGIFFTYDEGGVIGGFANPASPNFKCVSINTLSRTFFTSSVPVVAGQWYKLRIDINAAGTQASFYINDNLITTLITNIPATSTAMGVHSVIVKTVGTTTRATQTDYFMYEEIFTNPR